MLACMLWQLQVRYLFNFCCLNIIWINKWFCLLRQLSLYHYLGSQTLAEASSTIWGPGTIWGPASARIGGGSVCTIFYWMETSQMENKTRFGKRRFLVQLIIKVCQLFIKHFFEINWCFAGVANSTGLVVVTRVQLWSHDVSSAGSALVDRAGWQCREGGIDRCAVEQSCTSLQNRKFTAVASKTLHTAHCTLHTAHCTLHTAHCTLHTAHCTLGRQGQKTGS